MDTRTGCVPPASPPLAVCLLLVPALFPDFLVYQFSLALTYAIAILGLNLLMGFNGQISVAHGVFFAVGAYTTAIFMTRYGINYLATLPLAVATSALLGLARRRPGAALAGSAARLHHLRARRAGAAARAEARADHQGRDRHQHAEAGAARLVSRQSGHVPLSALPGGRRDLRADRLAADARRHRALAARGARQRPDRGVARRQPHDRSASRRSPPARALRASAADCSRS